MARSLARIPAWFAPLLAALGLLLPIGPRAEAGPGDQPIPTLDDLREPGTPEVKVSAISSKDAVRPGDQGVIAVIFDHAPGWHVHPSNPVVPKEWGDYEPIQTTIDVPAVPGVTFGPIQWPRTHDVLVDLTGLGRKLPYGVYEGKAAAFIPFVVADDAGPGDRSISVAVGYQACNDRSCLFPQDETFIIPLQVTEPAAAAAAGAPDAIFSEFDPAVFARMKAGATIASGADQAGKPAPVKFNLFGRSFSIDAAGAGFALLLLAAAFGGLLLNFTPCVLPVLPLKIMSLSQSAGNPARCAYLGAVMSAGTICFWLAIGAAIAFISSFKAINQLFQFPAFSLAIGVFIAVMGVGMLGVFTVQLPRFVYYFNPSHETARGSFLFGVMTAILSTPCTAPFMGTAAGWAAKQPPTTTLITFAAIGLGMALPYFILSINPKLVSRVPRTGPASELIKQVMGLLMIGIAVYFLGTGLDPLFRKPIDPPIRFYWWIVAGFVVFAMVWLVLRTFRITSRFAPRAIWSVFALALALGITLIARSFTDRGPIAWVAYTPERFEQARAEGRVVVMDFTAEWCLNCKALEAGVLHRDEIVKLLKTPGVIPMKVDLTGNNTAGNAKLKELNWVGIPLLAVFGPALHEPLKYDTYTVQTVLDAITQAGGPAPALARARQVREPMSGGLLSTP